MSTTNNGSPFTDILDAVNENLSNLEHNHPYTLEQLVGKEQWLSTHKGLRPQLGSQFKAKALAGELPVKWVGSKTNHSQLYELK